MTSPDSYRIDTRCTAFLDDHRIAAGELRHVALRAQLALEAQPEARLLIFDDADARLIDLDLRGSAAEIVQRLNRGEVPTASDDDTPAKRGRGRPRLGVVAREVTLLPRHWQWLNAQPGGASVALRKLVDAARREHADGDLRRAAQERAYRFLSAMGGDRPGFEEATRALFAGDSLKFDAEIAAWPEDLRDHATMLAADAWPH
ncbi:MAG: DUF2239 family protein [Xanthomonadaceae bacterium]|nr:DUF2239 family protein [Xanthomonadaceae bacterium]